MNAETRPLLYRVSGDEIAIATADPSVTLIEIGDTFGLLLAESAHDSSIDDSLVLEKVLWARGDTIGGFFARLFRQRRGIAGNSFEEVTLCRHESGLFVAREGNDGCYLPYPSESPYVVVFVEQEHFLHLQSEIMAEDAERVLEFMDLVLENVPGFTVYGDAIVGPSTYATGVRIELDRPIRGIQGERSGGFRL